MSKTIESSGVEKPTVEKSSSRWVYSVLPESLASGALGTLVQLYLIQLNGHYLGTIYATLAVALSTGASIPASIFWGYVTDRIHLRRAVIVSSYAVVSLNLFAFYFIRSTAGTVSLFSAFAFVSAATATPLNLLIMESEEKSRWADAFSRLSMMSSLGNVAGLVLSVLWAPVLPLDLLFLPFGVFSLISAIMAFVTIREPPFVFEGETLIGRASAFFARLLSLPLMFLYLPKLSDFKRIFRGLRSSLTSYVPLFYLSTICFYVSSGVFNTSFVPALSAFSLAPGEIFAVILSGMIIQTLTFRYAGKYIARQSLISSSVQGLLLRGGCYLVVGVLSFLIGGPAMLIPALVLYPLAAGVAFAVYYTSSNTMMFNTITGRNAGSTIGVYSAVVGFASFAGSLASGFISVYFGFFDTFILAGLILFLAGVLVSRMRPAGHQ
jgi:MFS family permease